MHKTHQSHPYKDRFLKVQHTVFLACALLSKRNHTSSKFKDSANLRDLNYNLDKVCPHDDLA